MKRNYHVPVITVEELVKKDVLCDSPPKRDNAEQQYSFFKFLGDYISGNG